MHLRWYRGTRAWLVCCVMLAVCSDAVASPSDVDAMLAGVHEIVAPGALVGPVAVYGDKAFPVITGRNGDCRLPIVAGARFGKGRVVLGGHEGLYGSLDRPEQRRFLLNTIAWLAGIRGLKARILVVGHLGLVPTLRDAGYTVTTSVRGSLADALTDADVLLINGGRLSGKERAADREAVTRFVAAGGGYFDAIPGWGWQQVNPGKSMSDDYGGNLVTAPMGLVIADGSVSPTGQQGWLADRVGLDVSHVGVALRRLKAQAAATTKMTPAEISQVCVILSNSAGAVPIDDRILLPELRSLVATAGASAVLTAAHPLGLDNPIGRVVCVLEASDLRRTPIDRLKAHPAAQSFPGAVAADAKRVSVDVIVDTAVPDWASTGLYAAPGEAIDVTIPANAASAGLGVRIGAHTDQLWHLNKWERFPEISIFTSLRQAVTRVGNAFGGPVYITVPSGSRLGRISVRISGAVQMPYFVQGETRLSDWRRSIRAYPAPWAELATKKIILTVPSSVVRDLDDPEAVLSIWDTGMDAIADLAAIPRERRRPERICCDQQISAGYMHSGYPIMTWLDVPGVMVDRVKMVGGAKTTWGFWHELGHNHQSEAWTFAGTGETTNNLFSLYCNERVSHEPVAQSSWLDPAKRNVSVARYFANGAHFADWRNDPGLSLMFYAQLQQAFGWGAYARVFAGYRSAKPEELPRTDDEKRDQFMVRFSKDVGRNLGPFFTDWGIPTSEAARKSVADLPVWLPSDFRKGIPFTTVVP